MVYFVLFLCFLLSFVLTPIVKSLAYKVGATDKPNQRKVHKGIMPRMGGLAIFVSFLLGVFLLDILSTLTVYILIGCGIIVITGILDDVMELSAKIKFVTQALAAAVIIFGAGLHIDFVALPFGYQWNLNFLSIPLTFVWIIGITNSINFIDGLDGLAAGVSSIALLAISWMAFMMGDIFVSAVGFILLASTVGFLVHNFYPAKIFLGDTGSLFLGFVISVLSLLGFKNVTFISLIIPIIILGVPLSDTFFAVVRRLTNNKPLTAPDKFHLHHCLLHLGLSHRKAVLVIYGMSATFATIGIILTRANLKGTFIFVLLLIIIIELFAEKIGWVGKEFNPILNFLSIIRSSFEKRKEIKKSPKRQ